MAIVASYTIVVSYTISLGPGYKKGVSFWSCGKGVTKLWLLAEHKHKNQVTRPFLERAVMM